MNQNRQGGLAATWRRPSLVAGERGILPRGQLGVRFFPNLRNWRLEAAFTGTLEAYLHMARIMAYNSAR